jgi:hypothetical protein
MKRIALVALVLLGTVGCGGKADVILQNQTSRYVDGSIEDEKFGLNVNGTTRRTVTWDGFFKTSIDADIDYRVHASYDGGSPVAERRHDSMKLEDGYTYTYEVFITSGGVAQLRLADLQGNSITGP